VYEWPIFSWSLLTWDVWIGDLNITFTQFFHLLAPYTIKKKKKKKNTKWVWEVRNLGPRPQITWISPNPEAPPGEMLLMKRVWMNVKNVWIFAKTQILHYPPL
jgi:hypothetical protein